MTVESPEKARASFESAQASIALWVQGSREQALSNLLRAFEENATCGSDWSWLAVSWQLTLGAADAEALAVLRLHPSCVPEWYFANALLLYRTFGDSLESRSALRIALEIGEPIARSLIGPVEIDGDHDGLTLEGPESYADNASTLWQETPGALDWLRDGRLRVSSSGGLGPVETDESNKAKHKLWTDNFEIGLNYLKREDHKQAKKSLRSALKAARHFGALSWEFDTTIAIMLASQLEEGEHIEAALMEQLEAAQRFVETRKALSMIAYHRIGTRFDALGKTDEADKCHRAAVDIVRSLDDQEKFEVDLCGQADVLRTSAAFAASAEALNRSITLFEESIVLQSRFLGENHPMVLETMMELHECLEAHGDSADAIARLESRMASIDPDWNVGFATTN